MKRLPPLLILIGVPLLVALGVWAFADRQYLLVSFAVAILSCGAFFFSFEKRKNPARELTVLAAMIAFSAAGRWLFFFLPLFKPVTAIVIITALFCGKEAGFLVGSLSALVSNMLFMQGPWTPFQMLAWGLIGFAAGALAKPLLRHRIWLYIFGALAGIFFSLFLDIWTALWLDGTFLLSRYAAAVAVALPVTAEYVVSNVIFLALLTSPIMKIFERLKQKYGVFMKEGKT